jgi:L-alanine-DL-glutamate epimerase-like enolase superfamily enzyme
MPPMLNATPRQAMRSQINGVKIARISPLVVNALKRNWVFVKIETDQGITGWGEASLEMQTRCVIGCAENLSAFILDRDPRRIEHLYQNIFRHTVFRTGWDRIAPSRSSPGWTCLGQSAPDPTARFM